MRFSAYYTDGRSAARRRVELMLGAESLSILTGEGELLERWPYKGLKLLEEAHGLEETRLHHRAKGDGLLTVSGKDFLPRLESLAGRGLSGHRLMAPSRRGILLTLVLTVLAVAGLGLGLPRLAAPLAALVPAPWEEALGEKVTAGLAGEHPFCSGSPGTEALERLTSRIAAGAERPLRVRVQVSSRPQANAFAAPGGRIIIMGGLIDLAETPEELAGVLAHEIAHGALRHPMQGLLRVAGLQLLSAALLGDTGALEGAAAEFAKLMLVFSYTRSDELEADRLGVELLNRAGISGSGLPALLERIGGKGAAQAPPALLSTHPHDAERAALIREMAKGEGEAMPPEDWKALRNICKP